jgi:hypothetical protein
MELLGLLVEELRLPLPSSQRARSEASFLRSVPHVVSLRSEEQMRWVNATSVVASVAHRSPMRASHLRDRPKVQLVTDTMCRTFEVSANGHDAIAWIAGCQRPVPALVGTALVHASPKALGQEHQSDRLASSDAATLRRAEPLAAFGRRPMPWRGVERRSTDAAWNGNGGSGLNAAAFPRAIPSRSASFSKDGAASRAGRIAVFNRWCHAGAIMLTPGIVNIRKYGLAGLIAGGGAAAAGTQQQQPSQ